MILIKLLTQKESYYMLHIRVKIGYLWLVITLTMFKEMLKIVAESIIYQEFDDR